MGSKYNLTFESMVCLFSALKFCNMADGPRSFRVVQEENHETAIKEIEWSQISLSLSDFVEKYILPQIVQIEDGYYSAEDDSSLSAGQVLKVHCLQTTEKVLGKDRHGNEVYIPLKTKQKIIIKPDTWESVFQSVADLAQVKPLPKFVEVTRGYYVPESTETQELSVDPGEKLEVIRISDHTFSRSSKNKFVVFKNMEGYEIKIPFDCTAGFRPFLNAEEMSLAEIINSKQLPLFVEFVAPVSGKQKTESSASADDKMLHKLGVLRLEKIYDEELIIASCGYSDVRVIFTIPKSLETTVKVAVGTIQGDPVFSNLCKTYNNFPELDDLAVKRREKELHRRSGVLSSYEYDLTTLFRNKKRGYQRLQRTYSNGSSGSSRSGDDFIDLRAIGEAAGSCPSSGPVSDNEQPEYDYPKSQVYGQSPAVRASYDIHQKQTQLASKTEDGVQLVSIRRLDEEHHRQSSPTQQITEELKRTSITGNPFQPQEFVTTQNGFSVAVPKIAPSNGNPNPFKPGDRSSREIFYSPEEDTLLPTTTARTDSRPSQLPTNNSEEPDTLNFEIPEDLTTLSTEDVGKCLRKLNMGHLQKVFKQNQINGDLLVSLEEDELADLNLTKFERKKLLRFVKGWRPDS